MAKSKYEYVKGFELEDRALPSCWLVVRIDGHNFHKFTQAHGFQKPNDERGLGLMNACADAVMDEFGDIVMSYGQSDEYSFVFQKSANLYNRRQSKISTNVASYFTSNFVFHWKRFFDDVPLQYPPAFDARCVLYPTDAILRDYLSWRQVDCHINNMYNTVFWALVHGGKTEAEAEKTLRGTTSAGKNEILFSQFGINYNNISPMLRKGTFKYKEEIDEIVPNSRGEGTVTRKRKVVRTMLDDIIGDSFWQRNANLLCN